MKLGTKFISALTALFLAVSLAGCEAPETTQPEVTLVETEYGTVQGSESDGVVSFKGIPYAAPPVDNLRFAPPQEPEAWNGVLECVEFRDSAMQASADTESGVTGSEDCLYLNIWKPADAAAENLPVYVYIHGGAYAQGTPAKPTYDGTAFAKDGVIQVNIAYRLNALGFIALEEAEAEYGYLGNVGTLDQIAALKWINENIEAFGGDPDNITIGGESAGSFSVSNLVLSPLAEGLFSKAIMESGNVLGQAMTIPGNLENRENAIQLGEEFMAEMGVSTMEELRALPAEDLVKASAFNLDMTHPSTYMFWPVFDGAVLPEDPYAALREGAYNHVDILAGFNADEGTMFIPADRTEAEYTEYVERVFGENAPAVFERYPVDAENSPTDRMRYFFKMGLRYGSDVFCDEISAQGNTAYFYNFTFTTEKLEAADLGSGHALELPFVFETVSPKAFSSNPEEEPLGLQMHDYWLGFITDGNPNSIGKTDVEWKPYSADDKTLLVIDLECHNAPVEETEDVEFFRNLFWG